MHIMHRFGIMPDGPAFWQGHGHGWFPFPFHFGGLIQLLIIGVLIYFIARSLRQPANTERESLDTVLDRRHAAGEIDRDTYSSMKNALHKR